MRNSFLKLRISLFSGLWPRSAIHGLFWFNYLHLILYEYALDQLLELFRHLTLENTPKFLQMTALKFIIPNPTDPICIYVVSLHDFNILEHFNFSCNFF